MVRRCAPRQPLLAALVALLALLPGVVPRGAAADISGNTYTSPRYGYTVTWDDTWFVVNEVSSDYDQLTLTNGLTSIDFFGLPDVATTPEAGLATFLTAIRTDPRYSDVAPLRDRSGDAMRGVDAQRAYASFTTNFTWPDGTTLALVAYVEARLLVPGSATLVITALVPEDDFAAEQPVIERLLQGLVMPGEDAERRTADQNEDGPDPDDETSRAAADEPAPVFVSGRWRIAVRSASLNGAFTEVGLEEKEDKEWLVVLLHVTNWSERETRLSLREFTLATEGASAVKVAPKSTQRVAARFDAAPADEALDVIIGAEESAPVVLVFSLPARSRSPELVHGDTSLPLADTLAGDLTVEDMPVRLRLPATEPGEIVSAADGRTLRVRMEGEREVERVRLLGVDPPAQDACYADRAEQLLDGLEGRAVLVEEEGDGGDAAPSARYVWLVDTNGARTLLNHRLIAEGRAEAGSLPDGGRFGTWLQSTERSARERGIGLWGAC